MIKKHHPFWLRLLLSPIAFMGLIVSTPIIMLLIFADFDKAEMIVDFWTEPK